MAQSAADRAAYHKAWHARNPGKHREYQRRSDAKRRRRKPCRLCGGERPPLPANAGYCSDECRLTALIARRRAEQANAQARVALHKESIGCSRCGYRKCGTALDWHHPNDDKERRLSTRSYFTKLGEAERAKCILLCANCHREEHAGAST